MHAVCDGKMCQNHKMEDCEGDQFLKCEVIELAEDCLALALEVLKLGVLSPERELFIEFNLFSETFM